MRRAGQAVAVYSMRSTSSCTSRDVDIGQNLEPEAAVQAMQYLHSSINTRVLVAQRYNYVKKRRYSLLKAGGISPKLMYNVGPQRK